MDRALEMQTPTKQRYPSELSRSALPRTSDVPLPTDPSSQHEYSSLAELLTKAGYKETRVFTPEAERVRSRSRTDLTAQSIKPRDSTAILRSIAQQDQAQHSSGHERSALGESSTWYQGPLAALGWPASSGDGPMPRKVGDSPVHPLNVGLGLAQGGQGVRRVKSAWDVAPRGFQDSPTLRAADPIKPMIMADPPASIAQLFSPSMETYVEQDRRNVEDEYAFDYGGQPLPDDYEAAGSDDDYGSQIYGSEPRSRETTVEADDMTGIDLHLAMLSLGSASGSGSDDGPECLTPRALVFDNVVSLDDLNDEDDEPEHAYATFEEPITPPRLSPTPSRSPSPKRPSPTRASTPPKLMTTSPSKANAQTKLSRPTGPGQRSKAEEECMGLLGTLGQRQPALKTAKSTPVLRTQRSWISSLSRGFWKPTEPVPPMPVRRVAPTAILSPPQPAPPALNVESSILCDSNASEGEDLPPIEPTPDAPLQKPSAPWTLRIRPSLQALRDAAAAAIGVQAPLETVTSPTLSPKLDWGVGGDSDELKGWGMTPVFSGEKKPASFAWVGKTTFNTSDKTDPEAAYAFKEPDFTQSFFYKPPTPPRPRLRRSGTSETTTSPPRASAATGSGKPYPVAKRARSIQSLRAALLLPVRPPSPPPPVPALPRTLSAPVAAPKRTSIVEPPIMVISSPGAWEAGLPPRELVLEGEEWDARESPAVGLGIRTGSLKGKKKLRKSPLGR